MIEYVAYQLNTDLSRAAEGTGPVKPDNLRESVRCQILGKPEDKSATLRAFGSGRFYFFMVHGLMNGRSCKIHTLL